MASGSAALTAPRPLHLRLLRFAASFVVLALFVLVVADVSTWWRTRDAAQAALDSLAESVAAPRVEGAGESDGGCTVVGAPVGTAEEAFCAAKAATGLPGLDVRLRLEVRDGVSVACAMVHRRSSTGLLGPLVDRVSTARRVVGVSDEPVPWLQGSSLGEPPFPGHGWGFCAGGPRGGS